WGSDYPHRESTWPRSKQVLTEILRHIPEEEQTKFVYSNAAKYFEFNV
ncbi:MAG: amidohydrolase family protein, partial [Dehalococcoidia bacterium]